MMALILALLLGVSGHAGSMAQTQEPNAYLEGALPHRVRAVSESDVRTLRGAIELVVSGIAVRVILPDLDAPDAAAAELQEEAAAAGVRVSIDDRSDERAVVVGPRGS